MTGRGKGKGKEVAGKRKQEFDDDKTGGGRKRKNRGVLQFFEDAADVEESDDSDDSDFSDDFFDEDFDAYPRTMNEPAKGQSSLPFVPKEEMVDEEEFDRMMEERYGEASRFIRFAGDEFDDKIIEPASFDGVKEFIPTMWKVKCTVGRERLSAFCLMQKFADMKSLGTELKIISALSVDHVKGFVYIEAEKQFDINEACQGIPGIYVTRVQPVPRSEVSHLFAVRSRSPEISVGMWARVKSGNYKGDLAQVAAVNNTSKKVTVKLVPRIDLQALAAKFGGGYSRQKAAVPAPRLISSSELEEFRPLIQFRRDRDTGNLFEVLDGLMLKDGYVYKKVSPDSLSLWGVEPTAEELLKFEPSENDEPRDLEWLSQLYGDSKKKRVMRVDKGGGKGEGSSSSGVMNGFELYNLVCFGKKDFGVIVGMDKDDCYKILKESSDGPVAVTINKHEIKSGLFDLKLSAHDQHAKTIFVNDSVKVLEGPSQGKQGVIKHIYRGIVFLYNESEEENGGYFTCKSSMCEKVKLEVGDCGGKDSEPGPLVFEDMPSSPRSPLSPKKPWQARENNREFNRGDGDNLFTIGQTLRIRIGPLKGYLCRVIALRRSDVTVKLDSQQKVLTVKCEHLSEVQGKSTIMSTSGDPDSNSLKPFDLLGTEGGSGGWMDGAGTSNGGDGWNVGGASSERSAWSNNSVPDSSKPESASNPFGSEGADDTAWETTKTSSATAAWGGQGSGLKSGSDDVGNSNATWNAWKSGGENPAGGSDANDSQDSGWNHKPNQDGDAPSGWGTKTPLKSGAEETAWETKKTSAATAAWGEGNGLKSGSDDLGNSNATWNAWKSGGENPTSASDVNGSQDSGWNHKPNQDGDGPSGWGTKSPLKSSAEDTAWETKKTSSSSAWGQGNGIKIGSGENDKEEKGRFREGAEGSNWGNLKSGSSTIDENRSSDSNNDSNWGKKADWNSDSNKDSNWGKKADWNSDSNNASNWGKKTDWNSDSNKDSMWGNNSKSSWGADNENKNSVWNSGNADPGSQDNNWGKKRDWNSGSGDTSQNTNWRSNNNWSTGNSSSGAKNEGQNETSDDGMGGGNWRGGYRGRGGSDRGSFRGRGFRGRGERGGFGDRGERGDFGGRGERGGFRGRGERGGFRGRGRSDGGFGGGRGRGRSDQSGGWNNRGDSGEGGSFDWKKGADNAEGWKNKNGSGSWNQDSGDNDGQGWGNPEGGSNKQWQSWSSASGGASDKKDGQSWSQQNAEKEHSSWKQGGGSNKQWQSWGSTSGGASDKKDGQSWNQGGETNKQWQSGSSAGGGPGDNWNNNGSKQTNESKEGGGWSSHGDHSSGWKTSSTVEEANIQEGGWSKGSNSNTASRGWGNQDTGDRVASWGQSSAPDKGASSSWDAPADGAAGSWGKRNDGGDKGGW